MDAKPYPAPVKLPAPAGMFTFDRREGSAKARIHLRVDEDGSGLLLLDASRVVQLNPTAINMAYLHLNGLSEADAMQRLHLYYRVNIKELRSDYQTTVAQIEAFLNSENGLCPVCDLGFEAKMPFSTQLSAPYRMDLAITYRCNNACAHCYNARERSFPSLSTADWKRVLDKVWDLRIPHVVFTGGEPTLQEDLVELVAYAQNKGLVTGLNTNGRKLADPSLVDALVKAGLDHVQITLESQVESIHDEMVCAKGAFRDTLQGLRNVLKSPLYCMTNSTLLHNNRDELPGLLKFLASEGVKTIGLNALIYSGQARQVGTGLEEKELPALLLLARQHCEQSGQRLIWYTPTQYCHFDPMLLDLGIKGCTAAYYNMCVEPDGSVLPCQSYYQSLGNILEDPWEKIWSHPLALSLRERRDVPAECRQCDYLQECGGGCPLSRDRQNPQAIFKDLIVS